VERGINSQTRLLKYVQALDYLGFKNLSAIRLALDEHLRLAEQRGIIWVPWIKRGSNLSLNGILWYMLEAHPFQDEVVNATQNYGTIWVM